MGFFDLAGFLWARDVRGGAGLVRDCGSYLVRISLPLLVRRRRYSSPSCSRTASRPPPIRSLTAIRLSGGLEEIGLLAGFPGMLCPHLRHSFKHTPSLFASDLQLHSQNGT